MAALPHNAHVSAHPCLRAKLSQLRSSSTNARDTKALIHEIATIVGVEALAKVLDEKEAGTVRFIRFHHLRAATSLSPTTPPRTYPPRTIHHLSRGKKAAI